MGLIEEIAEERLPEHLTAAVREEREEREEAEAEHRRARAAAAEADAELRSRLPEMAPEERAEAITEIRETHGHTWCPRGSSRGLYSA